MILFSPNPALFCDAVCHLRSSLWCPHRWFAMYSPSWKSHKLQQVRWFVLSVFEYLMYLQNEFDPHHAHYLCHQSMFADFVSNTPFLPVVYNWLAYRRNLRVVAIIEVIVVSLPCINRFLSIYLKDSSKSSSRSSPRVCGFWLLTLLLENVRLPLNFLICIWRLKQKIGLWKVYANSLLATLNSRHAIMAANATTLDGHVTSDIAFVEPANVTNNSRNSRQVC